MVLVTRVQEFFYKFVQKHRLLLLLRRWSSDGVIRSDANILGLLLSRSTAFGKDHSFGQIRSIEEYRRKVPLQTYDSISPYIDQIAMHAEKDVLTPGRTF